MLGAEGLHLDRARALQQHKPYAGLSLGASTLRPGAALRGAVQAERNDRESILASTDELLREMIARNDLTPEVMISCLLTCTDDLDAEFPAVAARALGLNDVPLLCTREMDVPGSMPRVIRAIDVPSLWQL